MGGAIAEDRRAESLAHMLVPEPIALHAVASRMKYIPVTTALALSLAACSPASDTAPVPATDADLTNTLSASPVPPPAAGLATVPAPVPALPTIDAKTLTLEGLGPLSIGQPVPGDSGFAQRGGQIPGSNCRTMSSPDYPGVYAIVQDGAVRRITAGQRSTVKLAEGISVGATEKQVLADFAGFRSTPHKYVEAPAKYLTAPNADSGNPALRFEIDADGKVSLIHIGTMPVLGYVEGCG